MKPGRNDPCPCGSGKKYKRCCMDSISKQHAEIFDDIEQTVAMNPNLTLDELNVVAEQRMRERNDRPNPDFFGLSPTQMANWLYAPFQELNHVSISTPEDLSASPVMRYLAIILDEAIEQEGSFKATAKGNLPTKVVRQASDLLSEFAVSQYCIHIGFNEFAGSNEDKFNALHYTRILAEIAGIIYHKSGRFHVKKAAQKQYQTHGLKAFFLPMLEAAVSRYNWSYLDSMDDNVDLRTFWLFMLWRLQSHSSIDQLAEEVNIAFPDLIGQLDINDYFTPQETLKTLIRSRFVERFLQFWGFVTVNPKRIFNKERLPAKADIQPLLTQTFQFEN
ncbi:SEC-C domain-containing protein [Litoribacillus peritrichatus]